MNALDILKTEINDHERVMAGMKKNLHEKIAKLNDEFKQLTFSQIQSEIGAINTVTTLIRETDIELRRMKYNYELFEEEQEKNKYNGIATEIGESRLLNGKRYK